MFASYVVLALSVSIDALGIGATYGLKNTNISFISKIILFIISVSITTIAISLGNLLSHILPEVITKLIGSTILMLMGLWVIFQALRNREKKEISPQPKKQKVYRFFIRFLGITIQIIRNPISSDLDHSNQIDWKEAIYLGIALSLDSLCVGIGSSIIGFTSMLFPVLVASFQLIFLSFGKLLGKKILAIANIPSNLGSILSGILLICIGIAKIII